MKYRTLFFSISLVKASVATYFSLFPVIFFGGRNDSEYYDAYARGVDGEAYNIWPELLRYLNDMGIYSRESVTHFIVLLGVLVIPLLVAHLAVVGEGAFRRRTFWIVAIVVSAYPTLFYYTFDIYRDVFMVFIFLLGLWAIKSFMETSSSVRKIWGLFFVIGLGYFIYLLRPYLGFGFLSAFFGSVFFKFRNAPLILCLSAFFIGLNSLFAFGFLDPVLTYREIFDSMAGGSNIGIRFESTVMFLPDLFSSFIYQLLGLYFPNHSSVVVFFIESIPFISFLSYLVINRRYSNLFVSYLFSFFLVYSVVWLLGNDNLGTAIRLRMFSYICIFIAATIVFQRKSMSICRPNNLSIGG